MFENAQLAQINIHSSGSFPAWVLAHYIDVVDANYRKLYTIGKIAELMSAGVEKQNFSVSTDSAPLYMQGELDISKIKRTIIWNNPDSGEEFWHHVIRLKRPVVLFGRADKRKVLYDPNGEEGLRIVNASVSTPISVEFSGFDKIIHTLFFGSNQERRDQELHQIKIKREQLQFFREVTNLKEEIERSNLSDSEKAFLQYKINELVNNQDSNDMRMGAKILAVKTVPIKPRGNVDVRA